MQSDESPIIRVPDGEMTNEVGQRVPAYRFVSFRHEAVENPSSSAAEGRKVFDRLLIMRFYLPGSKDTVDRELKRWRGGQGPGEISDYAAWERYAEYAEKFERATGELQAGTPLSVLNLDVVAEAELRTVSIATVEALAAVPDGNLRGLTGGRDLRARAQRFLDAQANEAPRLKAEAEAAEAKQREEELRAELREMKAQLDALRASAGSKRQKVEA